MEMVTVTDSDNNNVNANAINSALMTATRRTGPGCALQWWRWRRCQWWGGGQRQGWATDQTWDIELLCDVLDAWTFQVNFMYEKFLSPC
jgi:hypothetical protein